MAKYRIRKEVRIDELLGEKPDFLYVRYHVQKKVLWWWEDVKLLYEKWNIFRTPEEAEAALMRHVGVEDQLATDNAVVKELEL